jgi:hypothetical protein
MKQEIVRGIHGEAETEMSANAVDHLTMPWVIIAFGANDPEIVKAAIATTRWQR